MSVSRRSMELITASAITIFAGGIISGSLQLNVGWSELGPQSGYLPLRLGILLCITGVLLFLQTALTSEADAGHQIFASEEQLKRSWSIFAPTLLLVMIMPWAGFYFPSGAYLVYMARAHGQFAWSRAITISCGFIVGLYALFDFCFGVPLAKGPIEAWLGIY